MSFLGNKEGYGGNEAPRQEPCPSRTDAASLENSQDNLEFGFVVKGLGFVSKGRGSVLKGLGLF
jgi:hypothetical protein